MIPSTLLALMPPEVSASSSDLRRPSGVSQLSLQIRIADDVCEPLIRRGTPLPASETKLFTTTQDSQTAAWFEVYAGERPFCNGNRFLGSVALSPLPTPSYRSFVQLEVIAEIDESGHVRVEASEIESRALGDPFCNGVLETDLLGFGGSPPESREGREVALFSHALAKHLPVLLATRTVRLPSGQDIVIRQHQRREKEKIGTGGVLWESAIVLADYVARNGTMTSGGPGWKGRKVLELGAGTGLVAIALALQGSEVVATDGNAKVLDGAAVNIEGIGETPGTVKLEVFDWNSEEDLKRIQQMGPWDAIVGSDLVYPGNAGRHCVASNATTHPADATLLRIFDELAGPSTQVILALKDRTGEVGRFVEQVNQLHDRWTMRRAPPEAVMPEFRAIEAVAVLQLSK
eukprot:CAMPEP_0206571586 /NCGR_PEP_ID=MMETSP0325_2-20121206/27728_1 /ASSEMBLY_ACC=CAM_ASM_000347 /TAXON_ID=2866 /ORGANISM="Crypthecodinium cohnii, Strain Seligo" /LENGTH=403 /DNA_ID=CAMNT_0054075607 /DNA_START=394 /DNA_END=1602 /DNA_ORIENTATION=+